MALGGLPTTSFDGLKGRAAGDFVDFIRLAAGPILPGKITENGARRAIESWRKRYPSEPIVGGQGAPEVFVGDQLIGLDSLEGLLVPPPPPGYARLKNRRPRKQS